MNLIAMLGGGASAGPSPGSQFSRARARRRSLLARGGRDVA
jgi:hypothetical protein